jgi:hypothetical protein
VLPAFLVFCAMSHTARSDWTLASSTSLSHDDNVGGAQNQLSKVADSSASAKIALLELIPVGRGFSLAAGGEVFGQVYDRLSGLNNAALEGDLSLKKKWGVGPFVPWVRAAVALGRNDFADTYRDASFYRASLELGQRLDARWNLWAQYAWDRRRATVDSDLYGVESDVFSQVGRSFKLGAQYVLSERISFGIGSLLRHGDVVSTTQSGAYIFASSKAVAPDPTFGPGAYAYKLDGTTFGAKLTAEYTLSTHNLLGCGFQRLVTHARGSNDYADSIEELTWNYRF